jgi:general stress protein 26
MDKSRAQAENATDEMQELAALVKDIKVAMLTTVARDGLLVSRPLHTRDRDFDGDLYFFVGVDSDKVDELLETPQVNLAYASSGAHQYVSVAGEASIVRDRAMIDELWNDTFDRLYFKGGKDDPSLVLLRVRALTAEVWTAGSNAVTRALRFVKAQVTGDGSQIGEQHHIELRRH